MSHNPSSTATTPASEGSTTPSADQDARSDKRVTLNNKIENDKDEGEDEDEDEDEEDDEDYDPTKKEEEGAEPSGSDGDDDDANLGDENDGKVPDFSKIESSVSQVKTRSQRLHDKQQKQAKFIGNFATDSRGLVKETCSLDIDSIFNDLKQNKGDILREEESAPSKQNQQKAGSQTSPESAESAATIATATEDPPEGQQIRIQINYTFAGKLITESKLVDANSEEAKAYLNSTSSITSASSDDIPNKRTQVKIVRTNPITKEPTELRIKLKRPSLIDKFIALNGNNKKMKLSTLEKSRLDWASFIDKRKIGDDLKRHNRGGYLDKQEFLGRVDLKKDEIYRKAKDEDRKRQFQLQGK
ncbi:SWC5 [Candida margitis]|uniref:SWC5 n=1 Tax=Candida margitis TaxID=1775924 RepID=UPI0022272B0F|nr:SWC5 [Candida margitis]KAI5961070.1 SWC5 [Candida margitis]